MLFFPWTPAFLSLFSLIGFLDLANNFQKSFEKTIIKPFNFLAINSLLPNISVDKTEIEIRVRRPKKILF